MFGFLDIMGDVVRIVTFQPRRQPGRDAPERERGSMDGSYRFRESQMRWGGRG